MSSDERAESESGEEPRVVVRDRRRIDPQTGQVRAIPEEGTGTAPSAAPAPPVTDPNPEAELKLQLEERTADLQRLQAEYANYRKRIDRDREVVITAAKAAVATELLAVLDDVERAEQHGDLTGAFKSVADKLVAALQRTGLESFGHDGEPFDPSVHEAVQHNTSPDVAGPTVTAVLRRGYKFGDRLVRAALVAVTDHEPAAAGGGADRPVTDEDDDGNGWFEPPVVDAEPGDPERT
ncbi:MAG: nucleotide exchange factor GrpE [Labedaea sp.]